MPNIALRWANIASRCANIGPRRHQPEEKEHGLDMSENYVLYGVFGVAERNVCSRHEEMSGVDMSENHVLYRVFGVADRSV